jgi:hypothetical protein
MLTLPTPATVLSTTPTGGAEDPNGLKNLIADPKYRPEIDRLRGLMRENMARTGDFLQDTFRKKVS